MAALHGTVDALLEQRPDLRGTTDDDGAIVFPPTFLPVPLAQRLADLYTNDPSALVGILPVRSSNAYIPKTPSIFIARTDARGETSMHTWMYAGICACAYLHRLYLHTYECIDMDMQGTGRWSLRHLVLCF